MEKIKALPKRILLRGFDEEGRLSASDWALAHGVEVINMASLADLVVVGPQADASLLQKARVKGAKIVAWDQFQALLLAVGAGMQNGKKVQASVAEEDEEQYEGEDDFGGNDDDDDGLNDRGGDYEE
jgi:BRCT domain type II-containing protein